MSLSNITSDYLHSLIKLTEKKDSLLVEISKIEAEISAFLTGKPAPIKKSKATRATNTPKANKAPKAPKASKKAPAKSTPSKRGPKGGLGKKILAALDAAGEEGVKVVELAKKLIEKAGNLHDWFATTGKKNPAIKKAGKGQYKLVKK